MDSGRQPCEAKSSTQSLCSFKPLGFVNTTTLYDRTYSSTGGEIIEELIKTQVQQLIYSGSPVRGYFIKDLDLYDSNLFENEQVKSNVILENCIIDKLDLTIMLFTEEVIIRDCSINSASFHGTYFFKGITIERCVFNEIFYFDCGGHNEFSHTVKLIGNKFKKFVDFFDAWFMGPVEIRNCQFTGGTNLLCDSLAFDVEPTIENNEGNLRLER
ncbi:hypothetical protein [Paenibacillus sp. YYML68]|uniref:hypothetical protein n=1 Tax=Paenibacillus sp. YYML68 TaxID=2909250 RepID=UPI002490B1EC|nr:hypothetical protein [Paenibacillus sp. YYML68]